jgi:hypothetical protein
MAALGLPKPGPYVIRKSELLSSLKRVDEDPNARERVLRLENDFRTRIDAAVASLPADSSTLRKLSTSPYVLLFYSRQHSFTRISEIEASIIPAKVFSSMETSAGNMIEQVALPVYGWECVVSQMHTPNSALDGKKIESDVIEVATLKSGPRCLNDEMADNFADAVLNHAGEWAGEGKADHVRFTYGVLYGTQRQSNKKDWHILRKIREKAERRGDSMLVDPAGRWDCSLTLAGGRLRVDVAIRIGMAWWQFLGGPDCATELWAALIRACVAPGQGDDDHYRYTISDLNAIVSTSDVPADYNVSLIQESQLPWLFFIARHFCDSLI